MNHNNQLNKPTGKYLETPVSKIFPMFSDIKPQKNEKAAI